MSKFRIGKYKLPGFRTGWWYYAAAAVGILALVLIVRSLIPAPQQRPVPVKLHGPVPEPTISIYRTDTGATEWLKVDDYIAGVIAGEIEPTWPREALGAQAIVARTFLMQKIENGEKSKYGTMASTDITEFDAYKPALINDNIRAAVAATRGVVLTYDGKIVRGFFHSNSGGMTATAAEGMSTPGEPLPYLQPMRDGPAGDPKEQHWSHSFSVGEIAGAAGVSGFSTISIGQVGPSGRAITILLDGKPVKAVDLRAALDPTNSFRSTLIDSISPVSNGRVTISGRGWGHGMGMSQWGAHDRALAGQTAAQIATYYFPGTRVEQLWK